MLQPCSRPHSDRASVQVLGHGDICHWTRQIPGVLDAMEGSAEGLLDKAKTRLAPLLSELQLKGVQSGHAASAAAQEALHMPGAAAPCKLSCTPSVLSLTHWAAETVVRCHNW